MGRVVYSFTVSVDGFIAGPEGRFDWGRPDEELHRFHNERVRAVSVQLCGRRLYDTMRFWDEPAAVDPSAPAVMREFAEIWRAIPKVVVSRTLDADSLGANATLVREGVPELVGALRERETGDIGIGGADLAATLLPLGLVDELHIFVAPVVVGGGTPYLPPLPAPMQLELLDTRTFGGRVVHLRYRCG